MGDTDAIWRMLKARRVAVVGASQDPSKFSGVLVPSILAGGFTGEVFPVNPRAEKVSGLTCYPAVTDIPGEIDLVVIAARARFVPGVLHEAADKGAAGAIVISAGGRESVSGKPEFDRELVAIARERGLRLFGLNIQGVSYGPNRLCAVFWPGDDRARAPRGGRAERHGRGGVITDWAQDDGLGVSASISLGNQADICAGGRGADLLADDDDTRAVALYLEGVSDGPRFVAAARSVALKKPLAVSKCGRSQRGREAVASHTGSLAGSDQVFERARREYGVARPTIPNPSTTPPRSSRACARYRARRVLVVSSSGGSCALAADVGDAHGLVLPVLPPDLVAGLRGMDLAEWGSFANPLDLATIGVDQFRTAARLADAAGFVDTILLIFGDPVPGAAELAAELAAEVRGPPSAPRTTAAAPSNRSNGAGCSGWACPRLPIAGAGDAGDRRRLLVCGETTGSGGGIVSVTAEQLDEHAAGAGSRRAPSALRHLLRRARHGLCRRGRCRHRRAHRLPGRPEGHLPRRGPQDRRRRRGHRSERRDGAASGPGHARLRREHALPGARIDGVLVAGHVFGGRESIVGAVRDATFGPTVMAGWAACWPSCWPTLCSASRRCDAQTAWRRHRAAAARPLEASAASRRFTATRSPTSRQDRRPSGRHTEIAEIDLNPGSLWPGAVSPSMRASSQGVGAGAERRRPGSPPPSDGGADRAAYRRRAPSVSASTSSPSTGVGQVTAHGVGGPRRPAQTHRFEDLGVRIAQLFGPMLAQ